MAKYTRDGKNYYRLIQDFMIDGKTRCKRRYLGKVIPADLDNRKREFLYDSENFIWHENFSKIHANVEFMPKETELLEAGKDHFGIRFTYISCRISGSPMTLLDTVRAINGGHIGINRTFNEITETQSYYRIFREAMESTEDLTLEKILDWHWELFKRTRPAIAGVLRSEVSHMNDEQDYSLTGKSETSVSSIFDWYETEKNNLNPGMLAGLVYAKILTLHPFPDGNGRISRLALNFILHRNGYPRYPFRVDRHDRDWHTEALTRSCDFDREHRILRWFFRQYKRMYTKHN